jgi:hypothetical protein
MSLQPHKGEIAPCPAIDSWIGAFISKLLGNGDDEDATSGGIYILRGLLDRIEGAIPLSEQHRRYLVEQIPSIAGSFDDGIVQAFRRETAVRLAN